MNLIFAEDAKKERKRRRLTQPQVAELIGVAPNTYSLWENGKRNLPKGAHVALTAWANGEVSSAMITGAERLFARGLKEALAVVEGDLPPETKRDVLRNGIKNLGLLFAAWEASEKSKNGAAE